MRRSARRTVVTGLGLLILGTTPAAAGELTPHPPRAPRPWVGAEPWAGFRLSDRAADFGPPMAAAADDLRWTGWIAVSAAGPRVAPVPAPAPPASAPPGALERESAGFRAAWARARAAAERNDADATVAALAEAEPRTAEGAGAVRRLGFAAAVARGDRPAADSLFYRLSWRDGGRTAARLAAWRALERGEGARATATLEGMPEPTAGERAALALARWMADPRGAETPVPAGAFPSLAAQAVALVQARAAIRGGEAAEARRALSALDGPGLPAAWIPVRDELRALLDGGAGHEDAAAYAGAARAFLEGEDETARQDLDRWLAAWPDSPYRPQAYLLRGTLQLAAGRLDAAAEDLAVAESRGEPPVAARATLARAFLLARRGDAAGAATLFDRVFDGPLGARAEAELLADRVRLARLLEDAERARQFSLRLEEGFPDSPWLARSRADDAPAGWGEPFRTRPPDPPRGESVPELPAEGPWGPLLFGEDLLADAASELDRTPAEIPSAEPPLPAETVAEEPAPWPVAFAAVGGGGPPAFLSEGALGRAAGPVRYRAGFGRMLAGGRNGLPETDRFSWEGALGVRPGRWRFEITGRGDGRNDDEASALGLHGGDMDTDWRGLRFDAGYRGEDGSALSGFVSRTRGEVDAGGEARTRSDQTWFGGEGELRFGDVRWRGHGYAAAMDHRMPGLERFRYWFRDLRLVRRDPGGWYLGVRAALYHQRGLLMPVGGLERPLGAGWTAWVASEPSLTLAPFRETFVVDGDWQTPDLTLPAERRALDLRGGLRWRAAGAEARVRGEVFQASHLRRWERDEGLWREAAVDDAVGSRLTVGAEGDPGRFHIAGEVTAQRIASDGRRVPYTPELITTLELGCRVRGWRGGISAQGVNGRTGEDGDAYGSYLRWNLETAYRWRAGDLPLGARWLELWVRVENLGDVDDPRWPGVPGPGAGVFGGVQALYGD